MRKPRMGRMLGNPFDFRRPSVARIKQRNWNRDDPRMFTPKAFGWGYDLNLYQLARRLHLIRWG